MYYYSQDYHILISKRMKKLNLKTLFLLMCLIMSIDMTAEHMTAVQARSAAQHSSS